MNWTWVAAIVIIVFALPVMLALVVRAWIQISVRRAGDDPGSDGASRDHEAGDDAGFVMLTMPWDGFDPFSLDAFGKPLENALRKARVGDWLGHGFGEGECDISFTGPSAARMIEVMLPVLRKMKLPEGSKLSGEEADGTKISVDIEPG